MGLCVLISLFIFESSWYSVLSAVDYFVESSEEDKYEHIESLRTAGHGNLWNIMLIQRTKRLLCDFVTELIQERKRYSRNPPSQCSIGQNQNIKL